VANSTSLFTELEPLPSGRNDHIMTGAGPLPAEGYGTVLVQDDREQAYMMKNVMYVPKSPVNLFSTTKFNQENGKFCTTALTGSLLTADGHELVTSRAYKGIYLLSHKVAEQMHTILKVPSRTLDWWHSALGHAGVQAIHRMISNAMVTGITLAESSLKNPFKCLCCIMGKFKRSPFPPAAAPTEPLEQLHSDLSGPHPAGLNGHRYFCVVRDRYTGYTFASSMAEKSETGTFIKHTINHLERVTKYKVKALRTDNGGEYLDNALKSWLLEKGIKHELTTPETSQSNGVAERVILTIMNRVRATLISSNQPRLLWPWLVGHIVEAMNYIPSNLSNHTPHELLFGTKPNISHLVPFGTAVASWKSSTSRVDKLVPRAKLGRVIGYHPQSTSMYQVKGYCCVAWGEGVHMSIIYCDAPVCNYLLVHII